MLERHESNDIARGCEVLRHINLRRKARQILSAILFKVERTIGIGGDRIAEMMDAPMSPGDVLSAPPIFERRPMINTLEEGARHKWRPIRRRINGRNNQAAGGTMAIQTFTETALESRLFGLLSAHR